MPADHSLTNFTQFASSKKLMQFHRLRQFALIIDSFKSNITQIKLVRELKRMDEEAQITFHDLLSKLEKVMPEMRQLIVVMKSVHNNLTTLGKLFLIASIESTNNNINNNNNINIISSSHSFICFFLNFIFIRFLPILFMLHPITCHQVSRNQLCPCTWDLAVSRSFKPGSHNGKFLSSPLLMSHLLLLDSCNL
jgi:type III secretory pathway component EscU